jgi:hypothetical protein
MITVLILVGAVWFAMAFMFVLALFSSAHWPHSPNDSRSNSTIFVPIKGRRSALRRAFHLFN